LSDIVDYASTGRASCKQCKEGIDKGVLRIGRKVMGRGGKEVPHWHHVECFFKRFKVQSPASFWGGFEDLEKEDQQKLAKKTEGLTADGVDFSGSLKEFIDKAVAEYATSSRANCRYCSTSIEKNELRLGIIK
jgi:hypothetical protein